MGRRRTAGDLGMSAAISRRDFVSGVAVGVLAGSAVLRAGEAVAAAEAVLAEGSVAGGAVAGAPTTASNYPPTATGLRGQYPGSFEVAHAARDGGYMGEPSAQDTGEHYDLVIVGGGISGLSAAHFFRQALGDDRRILVIDNHDDFGGHAKRNEFRYHERTYLGFGGTQSIETPFPYSYTAKALIKELGIDTGSYPRCERKDIYRDLEDGVFFDGEHSAGDKVLAGVERRPWDEFFAAAPLSARVRDDLTRLHVARVDYMPEPDPVREAEILKRISYQEFLLRHARLLPGRLPYFAGIAFRNNMRVDSCPAYTAARYDAPGFKGMKLELQPMIDSEFFHFPDGNASVAHLVVSRLVPGVFPEMQTQESIVTAPANYDRLDAPAAATRIRLRSTAVHVRHLGVPEKADTVGVIYVRDGNSHRVTADSVVMACFNNIIRFIVPDLPEDQKTRAGLCLESADAICQRAGAQLGTLAQAGRTLDSRAQRLSHRFRARQARSHRRLPAAFGSARAHRPSHGP